MKKNSIVLVVALVILIVIYFLVSGSLKNNEEVSPIKNENLNEETGLVEGAVVQDELEDEAIFCTEDVLECEDGSFVGRVAPDCEFAACPGDEGLVIEEEIIVPDLIEEPVLDQEELILDEPIVEEPVQMIELIVE